LLRRCTKCGVEKDSSEFYPSHPTRCKACKSSEEKEARRKNRESILASEKRSRGRPEAKERAAAWQKAYRKTDQGKRVIKNNALKRAYGLTFEEVEAMHTAQGGCCPICLREIRIAVGPRDASTAHVDHDHKTGAVRALLCGHCNQALGHFRDNLTAIERAGDYLRQRAA
jgi:hypothetical protein